MGEICCSKIGNQLFICVGFANHPYLTAPLGLITIGADMRTGLKPHADEIGPYRAVRDVQRFELSV